MKRRAFLAAAALALAACEPAPRHRTYRLGERARSEPPEGFAPTARTIAWEDLRDEATGASLDGLEVRIVGFAVPLEFLKDEITEFLLVPYYGACIHVPPPPANQIISVEAGRPAGIRSMSVLWVAGKLRAEATEGQVARASYRMADAEVAIHPRRERG